jgi:hypothetical protein
MWSLTYNIVLFAATAGTGAVVSVLIGSSGLVALATIWGTPVGAIIGFNMTLTEAEMAEEFESITAAAPWAFAAVLLGVSVLVTYRQFGPGSVSADLALIVLPGLVVFLFFTPVSKLVRRV